MAEIKVVEVRIWEQSAGAVAPLQGKPGFYEFQYAPAFESSGLELSPLRMKFKTQQRFSFPGLAQDTFHGLLAFWRTRFQINSATRSSMNT